MELGQEGQSSHAMDVGKSNSQTYAGHSQYSNRDQDYQGPKVQQPLDIKSIILLVGSKILIVVLYFLLSGVKLADFIVILCYASVDFWMNKNIYGKKLAGLRWWIQFDDITNEEQWIFQSADPKIDIHPLNYGVFWISNALLGAFWIVNVLVLTFISNQLFWVCLSLFCFLLSLVNLGCFYKCRGTHQKKIHQIFQKVGIKTSSNLMPRNEQNNYDRSNLPQFSIQ